MIKADQVPLSEGLRKAGGKAFQVWTFSIVAIICAFGVSAEIFDYTIRPERVLVLVWLLSVIPLIPRLGLQKIPLLLFGWIILSLYSSLVSAQPSSAFRHWVDLSLAVSFFFVCQTAPLHLLIARRLSAFMWISMILGAGAILTAIIQVSNLNSADSIWANFVMNDYAEKEIYGFRIKMTLSEANLFGVAMAIFSLLSIAEFKKAEKWTWLPFSLSHSGLLLAFSRGPIIGYVLGLVFYLIMVRDRGLLLKFWGVAFTLLLFLPWTELPVGTVRHDTIGARQETIRVRLLAVATAIPDILNRPIIGNGVYSFSFLHPDFYKKVRGSADDQAWLPNMPIAILHDTGLIGLLLLYSFFAFVIFRGYRATVTLREFAEYTYVRHAAAWLGAAVSVLVASLTTPVYPLSLLWGVFAVCYCIPHAVTGLKDAVSNSHVKVQFA